MPHAGGIAGTAGWGGVLAGARRICGEHQPHSRSCALVQVDLSTADERQEADRDSCESCANAAAAGVVQSVKATSACGLRKSASTTKDPITKIGTNTEACVISMTRQSLPVARRRERGLAGGSSAEYCRRHRERRTALHCGRQGCLAGREDARSGDADRARKAVDREH